MNPHTSLLEARMMDARNASSEIHHLLIEYLVAPVIGWFDDLYLQVRKKDDRLLTLQHRLKEVPHWSATSVDACMDFLRERCSFLNEMITALFLHCIKSMTVIKNTHELAISVRIPKRAVFMHQVMIAAAKEFYENPFIFRRNDRIAKEAIVLRTLNVCAIKALPMKDLLNAYLNSEAPPEQAPVEPQELLVRNLNAMSALPVRGQGLGAAAVASMPGAVPDILERLRREAADMGILNSNLNHDVIEHVVRPAGTGVGVAPRQQHMDAPSPTDTAATDNRQSPLTPLSAPMTAEEPSKRADNSPGAAQEPKNAIGMAVESAHEKVIVPSIANSDDSIASDQSGGTADDLFPEVMKQNMDQDGSTSSSANAASGVVASVIRESDKTIDIVQNIENDKHIAASVVSRGATRKASGKRPVLASKKASVAPRNKASADQREGAGSQEPGSGTAPTATTTSVNVLTRRQQNALLDEILNQTRTREMLTPTFFSDAASKSKE